MVLEKRKTPQAPEENPESSVDHGKVEVVANRPAPKAWRTELDYIRPESASGIYIYAYIYLLYTSTYTYAYICMCIHTGLFGRIQ